VGARSPKVSGRNQKPETRSQKSAAMVDEHKPVRSFEDLEVFRRAYELSLVIHRTSLTFPKVEQFGLADQVRRASKSICANVVEGFGKQRDSSAEFKRFLVMAIGSCEEMQMWVRYCKDLDYIDKPSFEAWYGEYKQIAKMLRALHRNWK
jgi:four helix bundle protein